MIRKMQAASCPLLMLLLTLGLVTCSLLVARYAVKASSWWLSLLAVTVCLLGLCTWIQLAASRAGRWRSILARHAAHIRQQQQLHQQHQLEQEQHQSSVAHISGRSLNSPHVQIATVSPPLPPPYVLADLPPSYGAAQRASEPPPPYSEAVKTAETELTEPAASAPPPSRDQSRPARPHLRY